MKFLVILIIFIFTIFGLSAVRGGTDDANTRTSKINPAYAELRKNTVANSKTVPMSKINDNLHNVHNTSNANNTDNNSDHIESMTDMLPHRGKSTKLTSTKSKKHVRFNKNHYRVFDNSSNIDEYIREETTKIA